MELAQIEEITILANVTTGLFPLMWLEEVRLYVYLSPMIKHVECMLQCYKVLVPSQAGELPPSVKTVLDSVYRKVKMMKVLQWVVVATGVVLAMAACGLRGAAGRVANGKVTLAALKDARSSDFTNRAFGVEEVTIAHR